MEGDEFYLSDDSDVDYEEDRRKKFEYDELFFTEIQKQNASLRVPPARPRTRTSSIDTIQDHRASVALSELSIRTLYLLMDGIVQTVQFLKSCRSEAIVATMLLGCTLFQMMNVTLVTRRADIYSTVAAQNEETVSLSMDHYKHFVDLYEPNTKPDEYIPYFWKIPYSYQPIDDIIMNCFGATEIKQTNNPNRLFSEISIPSRFGREPSKVLTSLAAYNSNQIFATQQVKGMVFAMMKNPVHSTIDAYRDFISSSSSSNSQMPMPIEEYMKSKYFEDNWMTRTLTGKSLELNGDSDMSGNEENTAHNDNDARKEVTQDDLDFAMRVMSQKVLVGLYPQMQEYVGRLERFLSLDAADAGILKCRQDVFASALHTVSNSRYPPENTPLWNAIYSKNKFDMQVYKYAGDLFEEESTLNLVFAKGA